MNKRASLKLIDNAFMALDYELGNRADREWATYLDTIKAEEKGHRRFSGGSNGLTVSQATKLFAVVTIAGYFGQYRIAPDVAEFFHIKKSHFMAYAFVANYRAAILKALAPLLAPFDIKDLVNVDYAELNKTV